MSSQTRGFCVNMVWLAAILTMYVVSYAKGDVVLCFGWLVFAVIASFFIQRGAGE